jgi:BirA family biotin operon repressor/biotin-[acetyl-CoA-carboxylase] ligase
MALAVGSQAQTAGYRLVWFDSIGSTNTEGVARARAGEPGRLWLVASEQSGGRGRRSRAWVSPRGNLYASVMEIMAVPPAVAATLGFVAGVALVEALKSLGVEARLKWPNDVLLDGAKLSGIALEAETIEGGRVAIVTGIGVNVASAPQGLPYPAASLAGAGIAISLEALFAALSDRWIDTLRLWDDGRGMPKLREKWLTYAAGVGGEVTVQISGTTVAGVFETIDEQGHLIIATSDGRRMPIASGDVFFGDAASSRTGSAS